jgi:hypothetical protein
MKIFLVGKHWQIFIVIMGPLIVFKTVSLLINARLDFHFKYAPYFGVLATSALFLWLWTIVNTSRNTGLVLKSYKYSLFNFSVVYIWIYITVVMALITQEIIPFFGSATRPFDIIFCIAALYCFGFTAQLIKSVELNRPANVDEYLRYFFLLYFYPIGMWIIQPKINAMFMSDVKSDKDASRSKKGFD